MSRCLSCGNNAPDRHSHSKVGRRSQSSQEKIRRELHEEISDKQDARRKIEIRPSHTEVLL